jgi:hypothetical protein
MIFGKIIHLGIRWGWKTPPIAIGGTSLSRYFSFDKVNHLNIMKANHPSSPPFRKGGRRISKEVRERHKKREPGGGNSLISHR